MRVRRRERGERQCWRQKKGEEKGSERREERRKGGDR